MKGRLHLIIEEEDAAIKSLTSAIEMQRIINDNKNLGRSYKTFGDVYEVNIDTGRLTPLTHHYFHEGYTRALYLSNGDILLSGSKTFDAEKFETYLSDLEFEETQKNVSTDVNAKDDKPALEKVS